MNIVHIAPNAPYNDYWGYQENLLPKYQKKLGNEVALITTNTMHKDGKIVLTDETDYVLNDGVRVIRKGYKHFIAASVTNVFSYIPIYNILESLQPDLIFFHGLISTTIFDAIRYKKKHPGCVVVQDNHQDYNIGFGSSTPKQKLMRAYYRLLNKCSVKHIDKVYGVTPWRKKYAEDYFRIPESKTDLLIMGADDEKIDLTHKSDIRVQIRKQYGVKDEDFLIVTGGKIDKNKKIDVLMKACSELQNVKLLIFGNVLDDVKDEFNELISANKNLIFIGWIDADKVYDYFFAADLVFFPGQHSVLWEQACASKVPCVFEKWEGMDHINNGGNSDFISEVTVENIKSEITSLIYTETYLKMKAVAESDKTDIYLYSNVAKKSLIGNNEYSEK